MLIFPAHLFHLQQLNLEMQLGIRRNTGSAFLTVGEIRRDDELAFAAFLHAGNAFVPALDDLASTEVEHKGFVAVAAGVEFLAILERAGVMDIDLEKPFSPVDKGHWVI